MAAPKPDGALDALGAMIRGARRTKDLTQDDVAKLATIAQSEVSAIESGVRVEVPISTVLDLARVLDLDEAELLRAAAGRIEASRSVA